MKTLTRKAPRCSGTKANGEPCSGPRLTKAGIEKLLANGHALVAAPEGLCSYHARTPVERRLMSSRGGVYSPKAAALERGEPEREQMEHEVKQAVYMLIRRLLDSTLPGVHPPEPDMRRQAVGAYIAASICAQPDDRETFARSLFRRSPRNDIWTLAEEEMRASIDTLEADEQRQVWKALALAS